MMLQQFSPAIRGLILDADGVLWKDKLPIGDLPPIFGRIRELQMQVVVATNNATMTVDQYLEKLAGFGVRLGPAQIVTAAHGTADALTKAFPDRGAVYVIGETGLTSAVCEAGFKAITDPADDTPVVAAVVGFDRAVTFQKLQRAMWHIKAGARYYGTNPDATFPTPAGLIPGAGAIIAAVSTAVGLEPIFIGKPSPVMFTLAANRMGLGVREIMAVGDRLETDIAGGQGVGARTALVLSGVSTEEEARQWQPQPDLIVKDLATLVGA
jgi:4-nitrophenyl phosphatase